MPSPQRKPKKKDDSWESSADWYCQCVGEKGHHYHQTVVIPSLLRLLAFPKGSTASLLDLGCGPGVLARALPKGIAYYGVDLSDQFIHYAKRNIQRPDTHFFVGDATEPLPVERRDFDVACLILSLQNMEQKALAIQTAATHLKSGGRLFIVLNHPCFRIPRQSSWGIDERNQIQYRRIDRYLSSQKIPIQTNPSQKEHSQITYSFHDPLHRYMQWLREAGFMLCNLEEWCSDKESDGTHARRENRAREEIPLFLTLGSVKE